MNRRSFPVGRLLARIMLLAFVLAAPEAMARIGASGARLGLHPDEVTRFVLDLDGAMDFKVVPQSGPDRIVIDTPALAWRDAKPAARGSVAAIDYADTGKSGRIVLSLKKPALVRHAYVVPPREGLGWRFVLDLKMSPRQDFLATISAPPPSAPSPAKAEALPPAPPAKEEIVQPSTSAPPPAPSPQMADLIRAAESVTVGKGIMSAPMPVPPPRPVETAQKPEAPPLTKAALTTVEPVLPPRKPAKTVIVIDPGHGGVDPGAIGVSGVYEKNITLAMARELKQIIEKSGRYVVHLTRDRDVFVRLRDRVAVARQQNADLFVSLHADAMAKPDIRGLSVYTLSQNASDGEAQALAERENKSDLIAGIDLSHESADVANILIDLAQRETMNRSAGFAGDIVDELGRDISLLNNTHRFAGFAVLKAPDVPAVLIELGYLSNPTEERDLRRTEYRTTLAKAISRAVDRYFIQGQKAMRH